MVISEPVTGLAVKEPAARPPVRVGGTSRSARWARMRRHGTGAALIFIAPYVILFFVFRIGPAVAGLLLSFANYDITGAVRWEGLANFSQLFRDPLFWTSLRVTLVYTAIAVPLTVIVSLVMAQLCALPLRGIKVYRFFYFLPVVTSMVTAAVIWEWIYSYSGPANWLFSVLGVGPVPWLSSTTMVLPSLAILSAWSGFGFDMLILLAGLLAIPSVYFEAAKVDGASAWARYRWITLPQLKPALFVVVILGIIQSFQVFDVIYVMTGGGPINGSYSLVYFIYQEGFQYFNFGYASAAGVVLFVITLVVSLFQRRFFRQEA